MRKKKIVIFGAGGQGREALQLIKDINKQDEIWDVVGFLDDNDEVINKVINGFSVLGNFNSLEGLAKQSELYIICAIGNVQLKKFITERVVFGLPKVRFATLIHPSAVISDHCIVNEGSMICAHTVISTNTYLGHHVLINYGSTVGHDCIIHNYSAILPGSNLSGNVTIEECCTIGAGAVILPNVIIGSRTFVGAGAVVLSHLPSDCTAVGVPAKQINR